MKKSICIYFQIHHPERLRKYQFFDIGKKHNYFDNYANRSELEDLAENCYLPANALLLDLIKKYEGKFKVAFSISGSAIDQLDMHTPEVIRSFQELAQTGQVEFLAETYSHSFAYFIRIDERCIAEGYRLFAKKLFDSCAMAFYLQFKLISVFR